MDGWVAEFQTSMDDCNDDRCQYRDAECNQCHLRAGHPGVHDPFGASHLEVSHGTTWEAA